MGTRESASIPDDAGRFRPSRKLRSEDSAIDVDAVISKRTKEFCGQEARIEKERRLTPARDTGVHSNACAAAEVRGPPRRRTPLVARHRTRRRYRGVPCDHQGGKRSAIHQGRLNLLARQLHDLRRADDRTYVRLQFGWR